MYEDIPFPYFKDIDSSNLFLDMVLSGITFREAPENNEYFSINKEKQEKKHSILFYIYVNAQA